MGICIYTKNWCSNRNRFWLRNFTQLAFTILICGSLLVCAQEEPFASDVEGLSEGADKRSGARPFQLVLEDKLPIVSRRQTRWGRSFQQDKRGGGRNFQLTAEEKRGGGRNFQFTEQKRAGGRHFQSFTNEDYKRAGGRAFAPSDLDKRGGARPFEMNAEDKRAGGRAFQSEGKRAGGRNFQSYASDEDKRGGARSFSPVDDKRAGGRAFRPDEDKRGGARAFSPIEDKRVEEELLVKWKTNAQVAGLFERQVKRSERWPSFTPYAIDVDYFGGNKRAGARPFFGDSGWKRAGGRYFSRHFYNGMDDGGFGFRKRGGARPMYKRAGGRAFFGGGFGDATPYYSRNFYPEYMKKAPYLFDDDSSDKVGISSPIQSNSFLSELKRTQEQPAYWSEQEKRAGGRTFPIDEDDSVEKRMLVEISRY
uniref:Uncharacterized protein n=1 Tax=Ditylenchus dipsaci TaxID=166011 RepID=A0A915DZL1_9BILA